MKINDEMKKKYNIIYVNIKTPVFIDFMVYFRKLDKKKK